VLVEHHHMSEPSSLELPRAPRRRGTTAQRRTTTEE